MSVHTGALNTALAEALDHALTQHADEVDIRVASRDANQAPTSFTVVVWNGRDDWWSATNRTAISALTQAMGRLRAATGGAL